MQNVMKNRNVNDRKIRIAAMLILLCGFWGIFYPEFTLTADSYRKIDSNRAVKKDSGNESDFRLRGKYISDVSSDYYEILNADEGEVEIRFSFLERRKCFD